MRSILFVAVLGGLASAEPVPVTGHVMSYTTTAPGAMDGLLLDTNVWVHFPATAGARVRPLVREGDPIRVSGPVQDGPHGRAVTATRIRNDRTGRSVDVTQVACAPVSPPSVSGPTSGPVTPSVSASAVSTR